MPIAYFVCRSCVQCTADRIGRRDWRFYVLEDSLPQQRHYALGHVGVQAISLRYESNSDRFLTHRAAFVRTPEAAAHFGSPQGHVYDALFGAARCRLFQYAK